MDEDRILMLTDQDGNEEPHEIIDQIEYEGSEYVLLSPLDQQDDDSEETPVAIFKAVPSPDNDEELNLIYVEDEDLADTLFELFMDRLAEDEDDEDDEDGAGDD